MPPAARITDMHVCPMVTPGVPPIPHVGGPILPPGVPTVLIGFLPAATVTGMAVCVGPPDIIAKGSTGVFINFLPAARMGDTCAHGGTIVLGEPTVMIGEIGSPSPGAGGAGAIMAGLVATGAFSPKAGEAQTALLAQAGTKGAPPPAFTPPTYTPPTGPVAGWYADAVPGAGGTDGTDATVASAPAQEGDGADQPAVDGADQPAVIDESVAKNARPSEQRTAQRLADAYPEFNGRTFTAPPPPDPGYDWSDDKGRTYDAMGDGTKSQYLKLDEFEESIVSHLLKGNDYTVIDLTGYTPDQIKAIAQFVDSLTPAQLAEIRKVGF